MSPQISPKNNLIKRRKILALTPQYVIVRHNESKTEKRAPESWGNLCPGDERRVIRSPPGTPEETPETIGVLQASNLWPDGLGSGIMTTGNNTHIVQRHRKDGNKSVSWKWRNSWLNGLCLRRFVGWGEDKAGNPCPNYPDKCQQCVRFSEYPT